MPLKLLKLNIIILRRKRKVSNETYLWHLRLGHINPNRIHGLVKSGILNSLAFEPIPMCESYSKGKMTKRPFKAKGYRITKLLDLVHTDVCSPICVQACKTREIPISGKMAKS